MKEKDVTEDLRRYLVSRDFYLEEEVAKILNCSKADVSRATMALKNEGYSITASNNKAYWRRTHRGPVNTGREKGGRTPIDPNEPEWEPTMFHVRPPKSQ